MGKFEDQLKAIYTAPLWNTDQMVSLRDSFDVAGRAYKVAREDPGWNSQSADAAIEMFTNHAAAAKKTMDAVEIIIDKVNAANNALQTAKAAYEALPEVGLNFFETVNAGASNLANPSKAIAEEESKRAAEREIQSQAAIETLTAATSSLARDVGAEVGEITREKRNGWTPPPPILPVSVETGDSGDGAGTSPGSSESAEPGSVSTGALPESAGDDGETVNSSATDHQPGGLDAFNGSAGHGGRGSGVAADGGMEGRMPGASAAYGPSDGFGGVAGGHGGFSRGLAAGLPSAAGALGALGGGAGGDGAAALVGGAVGAGAALGGAKAAAAGLTGMTGAGAVKAGAAGAAVAPPGGASGAAGGKSMGGIMGGGAPGGGASSEEEKRRGSRWLVVPRFVDDDPIPSVSAGARAGSRADHPMVAPTPPDDFDDERL